MGPELLKQLRHGPILTFCAAFSFHKCQRFCVSNSRSSNPLCKKGTAFAGGGKFKVSQWVQVLNTQSHALTNCWRISHRILYPCLRQVSSKGLNCGQRREGCCTIAFRSCALHAP